MAQGIEDVKYKGIKPEIAAELREYEIKYFREDKSIPFCGLMIYPATVHDYESFSSCSDCLTLNKNTTAKGLRMSYLDYLVSLTQEKTKDGVMWSYKLQKLCEIVFHITNGIKCLGCQRIIPYDSQEFQDLIRSIHDSQIKGEQPAPHVCPKCGKAEFNEMIKIKRDESTRKHKLIIDGHEISSKDFDRLRQIILFQNFPDYRDDSWVDPGIKKDYEERINLERKNNDVHATLEKKMVCLSISTNYKLPEIYDMTIRKFTMALATVDDLINYKIMKSAAMSGFVSLPKGKKIEHWIYKADKDMYGDAYKSTEALQQEINNL